MVRVPTVAARKIGLQIAIAAILVAVLLALLPRKSPDLSAQLRIREGMTEAQVVAIFGTRANADACWLFDFPTPTPMPGTPKYWYCDAGVVEVRFDSQGKALCVRSLSYEFRPKPSLWRTVRDWVGL